MMDNNSLYDLVAELNDGARLMRDGLTESEKFGGALVISRVGARLVKDGGKPLLQKAHGLAAEENQRTIELQWFGLTDSSGRQWLP